MNPIGLPSKPKDFPKGSSDKELENFLEKSLEYIEGNTDTMGVRSANQYIEVTQKELQLRYNLKSAKTSRRLTWVTIGLTVITIAFAGMNIFFQIQDQKFDELWLEKQEKLNNELIEKVDMFYEEYSTKSDTAK